MEERSISKAAQRLNISQSAVSQSINRLKLLFDDPLFFRESHGVSPTKIADSIYPQLSAAIQQIRLAAPPLSNFDAETSSREFLISTVSVIGLSILPRVSNLIFTQAPSITIKADTNLAYAETCSQLRNQYDVSIDIDHGQYPELKSQQLLREEIYVLCRKDHPRLAAPKVTMDQFLSEKHVIHTTPTDKQCYLLNKGLSYEHILKRRNIAWSANNIIEMMNIVENSHNISLFPKRLLNKYLRNADLKHIPCDFISEDVKVSMFWHPARHNDVGHRWLRQLISEASVHI
jgi:DNA-binding transcriptional LysR family regulator